MININYLIKSHNASGKIYSLHRCSKVFSIACLSHPDLSAWDILLLVAGRRFCAGEEDGGAEVSSILDTRFSMLDAENREQKAVPKKKPPSCRFIRQMPDLMIGIKSSKISNAESSGQLRVIPI
jgi:hypothetical protein